MDMSKYFNGTKEQSGSPSSTTGGSLEIPSDLAHLPKFLQDILKEAQELSHQEEEKGSYSREENTEWFEKAYGDPMDFVINAFEEMKKPYRDLIDKGVIGILEEKKQRTLPTIPAASMVTSAADLVAMQIQVGSGMSFEDFAFRGAKKAKELNRHMSHENMEEQLLSIFAALTVSNVLLAEITATGLASERLRPEDV